MKKMLAFLLVLVTVLGMLPTVAFAAEIADVPDHLYADLPAQVESDLAAAGKNENYVYDWSAEEFTLSGAVGVTLVDDPNALNGKAARYDGTGTDYAGKQWYLAYSTGGVAGYVTYDMQSANANKGYQIYKISNVSVPANVGYLYTFSWGLQNHSFNKVAGQTVDLYLSMKIEGDLSSSPVFCVDRMMAVAPTPNKDAVSNWQQRGETDLRVGFLADTHMSTRNANLNSALLAFYSIDSEIDALACTGDMVYNSNVATGKTTSGMEEAASFYVGQDTDYDAFLGQINEKTAGKTTKMIYAMGNHEVPLNTTDANIATYGKNLFTEKTGQSVSYKTQVNGFTFVTGEYHNYEGVLMPESEAFIKAAVEESIAADATKPVFVIAHHPLKTTNTSAEFYAYLSSTPQIIVITAHTHYSPWHLKGSITQVPGGFTMVTTSAVDGDVSTPSGEKITGKSYALMAEVDDNKVTFYRMDLRQQEYIGEPWTIDVPAMVAEKAAGTTNSWLFTDARFAGKPAPGFAADAAVTVSNITADGAAFKFSAAASGNSADKDDIVDYYVVKVINLIDETEVTKKVNGDYFEVAQKDTFSASVTGLRAGEEYRVEIYPVSSYQTEGAAITADFTTTGEVIVGHRTGKYTYDAQQKKYTAACLCGCGDITVANNIQAPLPREITKHLYEGGYGLEHVIDATPDNGFDPHGSNMTTIEDTAAATGKALKVANQSNWISGGKFYVDIYPQGHVFNIDSGKLSANLNDGKYHIYNFGTKGIASAANYMHINWNFQLHSIKKYAGQSVTLYMSMKVEGDMSSPTYYIDRILVVPDCANAGCDGTECGKLNTRTVTFVDENGSTLESFYAVVGETPVYSGTVPAKEGYNFGGWSPSIAPVTTNVTYAIVYKNDSCNYEAVVTPPTCSDKGYTTYTCTDCGDSYISDYVDALGHKIGKFAYDARQNKYVAACVYGCGEGTVADNIQAQLPKQVTRHLFVGGYGPEHVIDATPDNGFDPHGSNMSTVEDAAAATGKALKVANESTWISGGKFYVDIYPQGHVAGISSDKLAANLNDGEYHLYNLGGFGITAAANYMHINWNFQLHSIAKYANKSVTLYMSMKVEGNMSSPTYYIDRILVVPDCANAGCDGNSCIKLDAHTVTFADENGTALETYYAVAGETAAYEGAEPSKEGFTFDGWFLNGVKYDFTQPVTGDIVLVAQFTEIVVEPEEIPYKFTTSMTASLELESEVFLNVAPQLTDLEGNALTTEQAQAIEGNVGMLLWDAATAPAEADATIDTCDNVILGATYNTSTKRFDVKSAGIAAKNLGDSLTIRAFYKDGDQVIYGKYVANYSATKYCYNQITKAAATKDVCIALLNYGAAAQVYFGHNTENMMNSELTAAQQTIAWTDDLVRSTWTVDAAKEGDLTRQNPPVNSRAGTLELEGAINVVFTGGATGITVDKAQLLIWTEADFEANDVLTAENATEVVDMNLRSDGKYEYTYTGVPAKGMFDIIYACQMYTDTDGNVYYGGVLPFCAERYGFMNYNKADAKVANLAKAMIVYGAAARDYFG